MSDATEYLKRCLQPGGTADIVPIGWHCSTSRSAFYDRAFVHSCVDEIDKVTVRAMLGETPTPLERLAIELLMESAHFESFGQLQEAVARDKARQSVTV